MQEYDPKKLIIPFSVVYKKIISELTNIDDENDTVTIALYDRKKMLDIFTYKHKAIEYCDTTFTEEKENGEVIFSLKSDPDKILNCRFVALNKLTGIWAFLIKPEKSKNKKDGD